MDGNGSNTYITKSYCDLRHKEVAEVKEDIQKTQKHLWDLQTCMNTKFNRLFMGIIAVLATLVANLVWQFVR